MRESVSLVMIVMLLASTAAAQEAVRMHGKHEHGHGTVNLAIDGSKLLIELRAPGVDILGFEHPVRTADDRMAVEKARTTLRDPLALFAVPAAAQCRVEKSTVALAGDARHEQEREHGHEARKEHEHEHAEAEQGGHMEFHAEYALHCESPAAIRRLGFPFFELFPRSRELDVTVITSRGQTAYEVERDKPMIEVTQAP